MMSDDELKQKVEAAVFRVLSRMATPGTPDWDYNIETLVRRMAERESDAE